MKAISLWQPWASLIAHGVKQYETRGWLPPRYLIGETVAIHAAKTKQGVDAFVDFIWPGSYEQQAALQIGWSESGWPLPYGCILGVATLAYTITSEEAWAGAMKVSPLELALGDYSPGRFAWRMQDPRVLRAPIPYRGAQGFFEIDAATEARLRAELVAGGAA